MIRGQPDKRGAATDLSALGYSTLNPSRCDRLASSSQVSAYYLDLIVTSSCNLRCSYCKFPFSSRSVDARTAQALIDDLRQDGLSFVHFTGGEATLWPGLAASVAQCSAKGIRTLLTSNGSAGFDVYQRIFAQGLNEINLSFDGISLENPPERPVDPARMRQLVNLAKTQGLIVRINMTITESNAAGFVDVVKDLLDWGVDDIKPITAVADSVNLESVQRKMVGAAELLAGNGLPILQYRLPRLAGDRLRGLHDPDSAECHILRDDLCFDGEWFYPCMIHLREGGRRICSAGAIDRLAAERESFLESFQPMSDPVCTGQCPDFMADFNRAIQLERKQTHGTIQP